MTDLTADVLTKVKADHITDLGSGAGGVMPAVVKALNADREMPVRLLPARPASEPEVSGLIEAQKLSWMNYHPEPADATRMETVPGGLKTMIAKFPITFHLEWQSRFCKVQVNKTTVADL